MNYRAVAFLLLVVSLLPVAGCDKATPVAPAGTILTISANPSQIGLNGRSTITVVGRKPDGNPLNPGTEIRLTAERGTIDSIVTTDSNGTATATFRADGRAGAVKISAATGGGDAKADTSVQVGQSTDQKPTVLVSVSPNNIPVKGSATVTLIVRNSDGTPVGAGQTVIVTTTLGTITDPRPKTKSDGTATTTLQAGDQAGTATVSAVFGSSDVAKQDVTIRDAASLLTLQADRTSVQRNATTTVNLVAFVANAQGQALQGVPVTFSANIPGLQNTVVFSDTSGQAKNVLTVEAKNIPTSLKQITVTATAPSGTGGAPLSQTITIDIEG
jgi:hypothetical protein